MPSLGRGRPGPYLRLKRAPGTEVPETAGLVRLSLRSHLPQFFSLEAAPSHDHERVTLGRCLLYGLGAVEEVLLPVVRAIVDHKFRPGSDGFQSPDMNFVGVSVAADLYIGPLHEAVVNPSSPAIRVRGVGVDNDWFLA